MDHLATTSGYTSSAAWLFRTFTRQLVSYNPSADFSIGSQIAADLAEFVPTAENGGITDDGRTYVFHLRRGVRWNSRPIREVTAHDVVRGMKLLCNPVNPTGAPGYYESTIVGMQSYCELFAGVSASVEDIKRFMQSHDVEGIAATDDFTLVFKLREPAIDFLEILAMPFASPVPQEYLEYLPDSPAFRQHTLSNGPYQITKYIPDREYVLDRNPAWDSATDPIRPAYVDRITLHLGMDPNLVQLQLEAGIADLSFDHAPPVAALASLMELGDPNVLLAPPGNEFPTIDLLYINFVGTNNDGALQKLKVRQAIEEAIDKMAIVQDRGGGKIARPLRQAVTSSGAGYSEGDDHYVTSADRGDPAKARQLLSEAGFATGLSLKIAYGTTAPYPLYAQSVQRDLKVAGIDAQLRGFTTAEFSNLLLSNENARRGAWDLAILGWIPDWFGPTNGRGVFQPLFDSRTPHDYGGYDNAVVNALIDRAITSRNVVEANTAWKEATHVVMDDAAIVPLVEYKLPWFHSARTHNCLVDVLGLNCSLTSVWLSNTGKN